MSSKEKQSLLDALSKASTTPAKRAACLILAVYVGMMYAGCVAPPAIKLEVIPQIPKAQ